MKFDLSDQGGILRERVKRAAMAFFMFAVVIIAIFFLIPSSQSVRTSLESETNYIPLQQATQWIIPNSTIQVGTQSVSPEDVYINDSNVFLKFSPATSPQPIVTFIPYKYNGQIDVIVGFNSNEVYPVSADYNSQIIQVQKSYTCSGFFNYTTTPKHFYCYNVVNQANGTNYQLIYDHDFVSGNSTNGTASWIENQINWSNVNNKFSKFDYSYNGYNSWYIAQGVSVNANQIYELRLTLGLNNLFKSQGNYKYFFGIKPHSESFSQAIANGHFYYIDPWMPPQMTSDTTPSPYVAWANSSVSTAWKVFSKNETYQQYTTVGCNSATNQCNEFVAVDVGSGNSFVATNITITNNVSGTSDISNFTFQGSNDNVTYTNLTNNTNPNTIGNFTYNFTSNTNSYRYYKLVVNGNYGATAIHIDQLYIWQGAGTLTTTLTSPVNNANFSTGNINFSAAISSTSANITNATIVRYNDSLNSLNNDTSLVGWWKLDGDATDSSGKGNTGTITGVTPTYGENGGAYYFNGSLITATLSNNSVFNQTSWSVSLWAHPLTTTSGGVINNDWGATNTAFRIILGTQVEADLYNGAVTTLTKGSISANNWYLINLVYDNPNSNASLYINGVYQGSASISNLKSSANIRLGDATNGGATPFNGSIDDVRIYNRSLTQNEITTIYNQTQFRQQAVIDSNSSANVTFNLTNIPDGKWYWNVWGAGNDTSTLGLDQSWGTARTFLVDTTSPIITSNSSTTFRFQQIGQNATIYLNATDTNLNSCWYNYNGTNITYPCSNNYTMVNITTANLNNKNLTAYANDSAGNIGSLNVIWNYALLLLNESYSTSVLEGGTTNFTANLITNGTDITIANISYNGTNYNGVINKNSNNFSVTKNITAPSISADSTVIFNWTITQGNTGSYTIPSHNQSILNFLIDNCTTNSVILYNFTIADEQNETAINATGNNTLGQIDLQLYSGNNLVVEYNNSFSKLNPFTICINNTLSSGEIYNATSVIQYNSPGYENEFYNIQNSSISKSTLNQNITLYDLLTAQSQPFTLVVRDSSFLALPNALVEVWRKYVGEANQHIVELPETDTNGKAIAHLVVNDVIYKFIIKQNGQTINTFDNVKAVCQTPAISECIIDFNSFSSGIKIPNYNTSTDFNYTLGFNKSSRVISSIFVVPSGNVSTISLNITKLDALGTSACSDSITSSSGTLQCTIPNTIGNATVIAYLYKDGVLVSEGTVKLDQTPSDIYGGTQFILAFFIILTLIGASLSDNPVFTVIFFLFGVILLFALNLVANNGFIGGTATILWLIVAIIIVVIKGANRN